MPNWVLVFAAMFGAMALGVPIPFSIGVATAYGLWLEGVPFVELAQNAFTALNNIPLMAIPLFVFAGALMERGGIADRLVAVAQSLVGRYTGSLGIIAVLACMLFAAISGSGPATAAAIGAITIPAMLKKGYSRGFAGAICASGGALGSLIPPSNLMVIYGIVGNVSIPRLFLAGMLPGILAGLLLMLCTYVIARRRGYHSEGQRFSASHFARVTWDGKWALAAPLVILGGIYAGAFTPTEAAAVAVFYAIAIGTLIYRDLDLKGFIASLQATVVMSGIILIMLGPAIAFGQLAALMSVPEQIEKILSGVSSSGSVMLLIAAALFIVTGTVIDSIAQIILFTPLFLPILVTLGVDPVVFGVIVVLTCELGFLTPPVGANLFVATRIAKVDLGVLSVAVLPFLLAYLIMILVITFLPQIALVLPNLVYGRG